MPLVLTEAEGRPAVNASYFSSINPVDGKCLLEKYSNRFHDCDVGLLANLYACEGKPGKVKTMGTLLFISHWQNCGTIILILWCISFGNGQKWWNGYQEWAIDNYYSTLEMHLLNICALLFMWIFQMFLKKSLLLAKTTFIWWKIQ